MGFPAEKRRYTIAEYLLLEEKAVDRHEFHDGEILAMSGGTFRHSRITMNCGARLHALLAGKTCYPLDSNMRIRIDRRLNYLYPDVSVVCGPPQLDSADPKQTTIINPRAVIEVLSDSTESYDRGAKFDLYRQIPSLQEYVLVSQNQPLVETYLRQPDGGWLLNVSKGTGTTVALRSIEVSLPLAEIYTGVDFGPAPQAEAAG